MKRIIVPTLLLSNLLFAKGLSLKSSLINSDHSQNVTLGMSFNGEYRVQKGDSLASIAKKHHISIKKFKKANNIRNKHGLKVGKIVQVPSLGLGGESIFGNTTKLATSSKKLLLQEAKKHLGKEYVWAANGPTKFDCSGFTKYVCAKNGIKIPRKSTNQAKVGQKLTRSELRAGDLIFFDTSKEHNGTVNHCGIYLGNNKFIHASSLQKKVTISSLHKNFYESRFQVGRRIN